VPLDLAFATGTESEGGGCWAQALKINPAKTDIDSFTFEDFELLGYEPHKKIAMQMAV
jgi:thymidylate synthase